MAIDLPGRCSLLEPLPAASQAGSTCSSSACLQVGKLRVAAGVGKPRGRLLHGHTSLSSQWPAAVVEVQGHGVGGAAVSCLAVHAMRDSCSCRQVL